ncbi:UNVERIFIED_CONTAM: hypothetical protein PYX00_001830 [Menopon gallinae]|uniref:Uncharacterized protein n=1 Tax=Menopon gallinae TaxID=328185 RepID=A0AAW2IFS5_9NEOP
MFQSKHTEAKTTASVSEAKHHVTDVYMSAVVRCMVLPQRGNLFYPQNRRESSVQLRVCRRFYGPKMRVQRFGWFLFTFKTKGAAGNRFDSRRRDDSSVPSGYSLYYIVPTLPEKNEGEKIGGHRSNGWTWTRFGATAV